METLGPRGLAVVVDLIDAIALGSGGIHIVVTDRAEATRREIEARCPEGWGIAPLFSPERDRLSDVAYGPQGRALLVEVVDPRGERFDPNQHEALSTMPVEGTEGGTVVEVMQKGYRLGEQLIRPARVVVSA